MGNTAQHWKAATFQEQEMAGYSFESPSYAVIELVENLKILLHQLLEAVPTMRKHGVAIKGGGFGTSGLDNVISIQPPLANLLQVTGNIIVSSETIPCGQMFMVKRLSAMWQVVAQ